MGRETKSQGSDQCCRRIDSRHLSLVCETLLPLHLFHVTSLLMCLVEWILFFAKYNLLLSLSTIYSPTGAKETSHVATVKNHMYVYCWTGVCNTCYSSN